MPRRTAFESTDKELMVDFTLIGLPLRLTWHPAQHAAYLTAASVEVASPRQLHAKQRRVVLHQ